MVQIIITKSTKWLFPPSESGADMTNKVIWGRQTVERVPPVTTLSSSTFADKVETYWIQFNIKPHLIPHYITKLCTTDDKINDSAGPDSKNSKLGLGSNHPFCSYWDEFWFSIFYLRIATQAFTAVGQWVNHSITSHLNMRMSQLLAHTHSQLEVFRPCLIGTGVARL